VVFVNGLHLEQPTVAMAEANRKPGAEIVSLGEETLQPDQYRYDFSFPKDGGDPNPHLWPNPLLARRYAEIVADTLARRDPAHAGDYRAFGAAFGERIGALDAAIRATVASIPPSNRKLLTYHDSWAYFAPEYGMTVVGAIQPSDFAEPSAKDVADLIRQVQAEHVPAIFGSEVFPSPVLAQIAREAGAAYVDDLRDDDLPGAPGAPEHTYIGLMVENLKTMARALGGDPSLMDTVDTRNVTGTDGPVTQSE
jgi:ABC-type Zn uptake system ZnuABC Zn-binding protein ZnuA